MTDSPIPQLATRFDALGQRLPDEGIEFWFARDLMEPLGYARWENFTTAIQRAIEYCKSTGYEEADHFRGVTKMIETGKGAQPPVEDFMLTRHACYLVAQNGEPSITREHVQNNHSVRVMLGQRGIAPEQLPAEEDIKKLERRVKSEEKKLARQAGKLPGAENPNE